MKSVFYPNHIKDTRVIIMNGKYKFEEGYIKADPTGNTQQYFYVKLDIGQTINLHGKSIQVLEYNTKKPSRPKTKQKILKTPFEVYRDSSTANIYEIMQQYANMTSMTYLDWYITATTIPTMAKKIKGLSAHELYKLFQQEQLLEKMKTTPVTGKECMDVGFSNDSMGEIFDEKGMYYVKEHDGMTPIYAVKRKNKKQ